MTASDVGGLSHVPASVVHISPAAEGTRRDGWDGVALVCARAPLLTNRSTYQHVMLGSVRFGRQPRAVPMRVGGNGAGGQTLGERRQARSPETTPSERSAD